MEIFTEEYEFNPEKKYIHYFDDVIDYQKYAGSERYAEPHVSVHFEEEGEDAPVLLRYNKDVRKEFERYRKPLTFEVLSAGTLYFTNANDSYKNRRNLMYKVNDEDWVTIESGITKQYFGIPEESVPFDPSSVTSSIEDIGTYGFVLCASTGYYTSTNKGVHSSAAVSRITFNTLTPCNVVFNYINYAEGGYDYGVFGNLDANIGTGTSSNNVYLQATNSSSVQTLTYSVSSPGQHFIEVKFRKDSSANSNNDNLQFNFSFTEYVQTELEVKVGDIVQVKADNAAYGYSTGTSFYSTFNGTAVVKVSGNIMSLLDSETFSTLFRIDRPYTFYSLFYQYTGLTSDGELVLPATTLANYCYQKMFYGCSKLTIAPDLPSENLASTCYASMFYNCTSLTEAPELPATTLASDCYYQMFYGCTGLTEAPELPATTLASNCYYQMFYDCASLIEAPELPATTLESNCYNGMFGGCTGLTTAPELPATTLATSCYGNMFINCTRLTTAPELPATTLAQTCYYNMFSFCTGLTTAPELPATTLASNCYEYMFRGCTRLTTAPELPATTLANSCYIQMFYNCTSLTEAPELPATALTSSCYYNMFQGCTSLTTAPELPATTLANSCYSNMFYGCTGLTEAPELPATTLADYCYNNMFYGCTHLTEAPELPATTLANYCYNSMFYNCTSLTTAPELPATTLSNYCYYQMFYYCTSLTEAPELPATTLANYCYYQMFYYCTKLNYIKCLATNISASNCLYYWTYSVSPTGTFVKNVNMSGWTRGYNGIPTNWVVEDDYSTAYLIFESIDGGTFKFSGSTASNTLNYSLDSGQTWVALAHDTETPSLSVGQSIMWKGEATPLTNEGIGTFIANGEYNIKGNAMSLLYGDDFVGQDSLEGKDYAFYCLFRGDRSISANTHVVNAEKLILPATTLSEGCYFSMFSQCRNLLSAPELPAKTMEYACYQSMFYNCESLTEGPELPATVLAERCYRSLFRGCTNLTTSPELPATTLVEQCYQTMFSGCSSLNYIACMATDISSTNCTNGWVNGVASAGTFVKAYNFYEWTIGINGVPLGWEVIVDYRKIPLTFKIHSDGVLYWGRNTTSMTQKTIEYSKNGAPWISITSDISLSAPSISVTTGDVVQFRGNNITYSFGLGSYNRFYSSNCEFDIEGNLMSLIDATNFSGLTSLPSGYLFACLFRSCKGLKNARELFLPATKLSGYCYSWMFQDCSNLETAPSTLPATNLSGANACYMGMFKNCTSLTAAPSLPATILCEKCYGGHYDNEGYDGMFQGCTSLTTAPALPATTLAVECYAKMFNGCSGLTSAPDLPATTLAQYCYSRMFGGCKSLTTAPELPATTLKDSCYYSMFNGCTSLTEAPELPATTLTGSCYQYMFSNCTSLTAAPLLPAATLVSYCYSNMFNGCVNLNYIKCLATEKTAYGCTENWVGSVSTSGTFIKNKKMDGWARGNAGIPYDWICDDIDIEPLTFEISSNGNVTWKINNNDYPTTIQYSKNGGEWTNITSTSAGTSIGVVSGDTVQFRGDNLTYTQYVNNGYSYNSFKTTCSFKVKGNINSLISSTGYVLSINESLVGSRTFYGLFENCTGMTDASELSLPLKNLKYLSYAYMFDACTNLTKAPKLPTMTLAESCYLSMFRSCTSLTIPPELRATTLHTNCYRSMFYNCTGLVSSPELPAKTLAPYCYMYMFYGCNNLSQISCYATDISASACTGGWVQNVATAGTFYMDDNMNDWTIGNNGIPTNWVTQNPRNSYLTFFISSDGVISWKASNTAATRTIEYKKNDDNWVSITSSTGTSYPTINVVAGDKVQFRGDNNSYATNTSRNSTFGSGLTTCEFSLYGNAMSLISSSGYTTLTQLTSSYVFCNLFDSCTTLTSASNLILPATGVPQSAYYYMFNNCTSLITPPELPATSLNSDCYGSMFCKCISLTTAPELPATNLQYKYRCYNNMFQGCISLTTAPELPAMILADSCYGGMFKDCISLTTAPDLPATALGQGCYNSMFQGCTKLTTAPDLPATILGVTNCYNNMFQGCISLTTAPEILATAITQSYCCSYMFAGCTSLVTAPELPATNLNGGTGCYLGMFSACTSLTTAPELPATNLSGYCYQSMFQGCTSLTTAPELPATTLYDNCYNSMFYGCKNLITAPELPATTLKPYCYNSMFSGCESLTTAPELPATNLSGYCYQFMFAGCESLTTAPELPATIISGATSCYRGMFSACTSLTTAPELLPTALTYACYEYMFTSCYSLTSAPELPATKLSSYAYQYMFQNCTSLTTAPELPATNLSGATYCYSNMFRNCTKLVTAPELPATNLSGATYCYSNMFNSCTSLKTAPELPATTLESNCYYAMFYNCTGLTTAPALPATTLANYCYQSMFGYCSSLRTVPSNYLPATTLANYCYESMFQYCTSLLTAPELPAPTMVYYCYNSMFKGCTNLNYIKCLATNPDKWNSNSGNWVNGVQTTSGTFIKSPNATVDSWGRGASGIPDNWTVQDAT